MAESARDRWLAQNRARLVDRLGIHRVEEWESVINDHRLPDSHVPDYMVLLLMDAAFHQGAFREQVKSREKQRNVEQSVPPMIRHWFRSECPECHEKWLSSHWDAFRYPMHYASRHLGIPIWRKL